MQLFDFLNENLSLEEFAELFNLYEEDRGEDGSNEALYDLEDAEDYDLFIEQYGGICLDRCLNEGRYWIGGNSYYDNIKDKSSSRISPIQNFDKTYLEIFENIVSPFIEEKIRDNLKETYSISISDMDAYYKHKFNIIAYMKYQLEKTRYKLKI